MLVPADGAVLGLFLEYVGACARGLTFLRRLGCFTIFILLRFPTWFFRNTACCCSSLGASIWGSEGCKDSLDVDLRSFEKERRFLEERESEETEGEFRIGLVSAWLVSISKCRFYCTELD